METLILSRAIAGMGGGGCVSQLLQQQYPLYSPILKCHDRSVHVPPLLHLKIHFFQVTSVAITDLVPLCVPPRPQPVHQSH